jgi:hypothetical protein
MIVTIVIILGLSIVTVPQAISYMTTRNLDDAIFKLASGSSWPENVIAGINTIQGVKIIVQDDHTTRLVVTYDRRIVQISDINTVFNKSGINVTLLNQINHRQHQNTLKEEKELETP